MSIDSRQEIIGSHNAPFFPSREFDLPRLEKCCVCDLVIVGNWGPLMIACSNVHVFGEYSISSIAFSTDF